MAADAQFAAAQKAVEKTQNKTLVASAALVAEVNGWMQQHFSIAAKVHSYCNEHVAALALAKSAGGDEKANHLSPVTCRHFMPGSKKHEEIKKMMCQYSQFDKVFPMSDICFMLFILDTTRFSPWSMNSLKMTGAHLPDRAKLCEIVEYLTEWDTSVFATNEYDTMGDLCQTFQKPVASLGRRHLNVPMPPDWKTDGRFAVKVESDDVVNQILTGAVWLKSAMPISLGDIDKLEIHQNYNPQKAKVVLKGAGLSPLLCITMFPSTNHIVQQKRPFASEGPVAVQALPGIASNGSGRRNVTGSAEDPNKHARGDLFGVVGPPLSLLFSQSCCSS